MLHTASVKRLGLSLLTLLVVAACSSTPARRGGPAILRQPPAKAAPAAAATGTYKLGVPYRINGRLYAPEYDPHYQRVGTASWYGADFDGLPTANGETFDRRLISAAHPTLPLPSIVRVTNLGNGRSLDVRVNDRGPFVDNRLIDLSEAAARRLGYASDGLARVRVQFLRLAPSGGAPPVPEVVVAQAAPTSPPPAPRALPPSQRPPGEAGLPGGGTPAVVVSSLPPQPVQPPSASVLRPSRAAAPAVVRPPPTACRAGPYTIQIGAFGETDALQAATATLRGLGRLQIEPVFAQGRPLARLRLGPAANRAAAVAVLDRVRTLGYPSAIAVPVNPTTPAIPC